MDSLNLAEGVWRHAASQPAADALSIDGRVWSYAQLRREASVVAAQLGSLSRPDGRELRVGVLASRSIETYAGILGAAAAGGTYVALHPKQPPRRLASILENAALDAVVVDSQGAARIDAPEVRRVLPDLVIDGRARSGSVTIRSGNGGDEEAGGGLSSPVPVAAGHPAYVMFTSGTTGVPKGVVVTCSNVAHFLAEVRRRYAIGPADRVSQFGEASFDLSIFEIFAAWDGGACLCVIPESQLMAPAGFIRRERITVWTSVPSVVAILSRMKLLEPDLFPTLRASFFIGEALPVQSARAWQAAAPSSVIDNQYGPTEATCACTVQRVVEPICETPGRGTVAIGVPYAGMRAEVVSDGVFLTDGETGELALHGPQLATGYLDDAELTARRFPVLDHPQVGRGRWYLTGDLAFRDAAGILHWLGRTDHQVKIQGHRVELEDIEAQLRAASGSDSVAAVVLQAAGAAQVAAFVSGAVRPVAEIRETLRNLLPPYMLPRRILEVAALPLTVNGKVDRAALHALVEGGAS